MHEENPPPQSGNWLQRSLINIIHLFWRPIGILLFILNAALLFKLVQFNELYGPTSGLGALLALTAAMLSMFELQVVLWLLGDRQKWLDLRDRGARLLVGGVALAFVLAGFLAYHERSSFARNDSEDKKSRQEIREMYTPEVQAGAEAVKKVQEWKRLREEKRFAASQAASPPTTHPAGARSR